MFITKRLFKSIYNIKPPVLFYNYDDVKNIIKVDDKKVINYNDKKLVYIDNTLNELIYYNSNYLWSSYDKKEVIYIAYIGEHKNEHLFKFGITTNIKERFVKHDRHFKTFHLFHIFETYDTIHLEKLIKTELRLRKMLRTYEANDILMNEIFTANEVCQLLLVVSIIGEMIKNNIEKRRRDML